MRHSPVYGDTIALDEGVYRKSQPSMSRNPLLYKYPPSDSSLKSAPSSFSRRTFLYSSGAFLTLHAARLRASPLPASQSPLMSLCLATAQTSSPPMLAKFIEKLDPAS